MAKKIKNILFDLGGVFLDVDYNRTEAAFESLGIDFGSHFTQHHSSTLFEDLECGRLTPEEFYDRFKQEIRNIDTIQIQEAWNAMLLNWRLQDIETLKSVRHRYRVFLYSNTNQIHKDHFVKTYKEQVGGDFDSLFEAVFYSHEFGYRKPYCQSFQRLLETHDLKPEETLFVDDSIKNILGAQEAGMTTIHLTNGHLSDFVYFLPATLATSCSLLISWFLYLTKRSSTSVSLISSSDSLDSLSISGPPLTVLTSSPTRLSVTIFVTEGAYTGTFFSTPTP
ncbi:HAD-like domain-containing protein [Gorgonomyces haynaldii]|nr:HAD-like domain-containing protein [Gorgonomyces haynaldii]